MQGKRKAIIKGGDSGDANRSIIISKHLRQLAVDQSSERKEVDLAFDMCDNAKMRANKQNSGDAKSSAYQQRLFVEVT